MTYVVFHYVLGLRPVLRRFAECLVVPWFMERARVAAEAFRGGIGTWPPVPVQLHSPQGDPWVEPAEIDGMHAAVCSAGQRCEEFTCPGHGCLFDNDDGPDFDRQASALVHGRISAFLREIDAASGK